MSEPQPTVSDYLLRPLRSEEEVRALRAVNKLRPTESDRRDALMDSAYIAGAKAGYNLGINEDQEGLAKLIEARAGYLAPLRRVSARQLECWFTLPGSDCRLRVDVDFDEHGVPSINDVMDASGERFPVDEIWFRGKPLEDVLIEWLRETPVDELRRI